MKVNDIFESADGIMPEEALALCQDGTAYIEEIEPENGTRRFQIVAVSEPTEEELFLQSYQAELAEKEQWLGDHDYIGTKIATGRATAEDYADEIATMTQYAARVEELREKIAALSA